MSIPPRDIFFAPFRLDAENGRLWNGARELPIRPKTFAVLRHLAENPGRLVTVADLVHAVWADSHGSAPLVKGCVREVRKLLGEDPTAPRYIETVGRRGYRFVAPIEVVSAASASSWASDHAGSTFVGRHAEVEQLGACLDAALAGTRQILFLTGEPGVGKTTLAGHFLAAAAARHQLRVARGQCIEHYGPGEPYLPVLQALATMCRGPGGDRVLDVLGRYAPTWLAQLPPLLSEAERDRLLARVAGTNRERMLREMCDAVEALAAERPFILWLDDLHWSDPSTVDLISSLALRVERARLLLLGTYRPADVVVSGHPLGSARHNLLSSGHARELALGALCGADVQRYLALRFPASELPPAFGTTVLEITDGNALFLASLLDELVAQGVVLADEDGRWRLRKRVEALADVIPESLRHLIERQVERLTAGDQRILEAGSTAGREFSAGAVAAALGLDADEVDERLQALTHSARLIDARGLDSPPHRATSGRHAFVHVLHQRVFYGRLSPARRARLHRRLGEAQETAWGDRSDEIAAELALHFERGGAAPRAIRFLRVAAENAARRLAGTEAIAHLTRALGLVDHLARRDRPLEELRLQMALGLMLMNTRGHSGEVERTYRRAADLSRRIENRPELYRMLRGLHRITLIRGDIDRAMALARKGVAMARKSREPEELLEAHVALGVTLFYAGELTLARAALARGLRLRRAMHPSSPALRMLDPAIVIRAHLGFLSWLFGEEAVMLEHLSEMRRDASALGQLLSLAYSHIGAAMLHQFARDTEGVRADADALLALSTEHGFSMFVALARCARGWALAVGSGQRCGVDEIRAGIEQWQATGAEFLVPYQLGLLGDAQAAVGEPEAALGTIEAALAVATRTGERWWEPELLRLAGDVRGENALRARGTRRVLDRRTALVSLRRAAVLARRQGARALVQRARESLARLT